MTIAPPPRATAAHAPPRCVPAPGALSIARPRSPHPAGARAGAADDGGSDPRASRAPFAHVAHVAHATPRRPGTACTLVVAGALAAAFVGLSACSAAPTDETTATTNPIPVTVAPVATGAADRVITATGTVTAAPDADLVVIAPQAARIARIGAAIGDRVARGGLLVEFEIPALAAERAQRESEVLQGQAHVKNAEANSVRLSHLVERGIAAQKEAEDAQRDLADARAMLAQALEGRSASETLATRRIVRAPFDGIVAQRGHSVGELVDTASATPVLRFVDPHRLQVDAAIAPADAPLVHMGERARIRGLHTASTDQAWEGRVLTVPLVIDPASGAAPARLSLPPNVAPVGLPVQVDITVERVSGLMVPAAAIVREGGSTFVVTVGADNVAHRQEVTVGLATSTVVQILSGVTAGDRVATSGHQALPDGAAVRVQP